MSIQRAHIWTKQGTENLSPPLFTERSDSISIQYNLDIRIFKIATRNFGCAHDRASQHSWGPGFKSQQNQNESPYTKPPNPTDYSSVCLRVLRTPSQNWNSQIKSLSIRLVLKGPSSGVVPFLQGLFMERWDGVNIWMMRQLSSKMLLSPPPPSGDKAIVFFLSVYTNGPFLGPADIQNRAEVWARSWFSSFQKFYLVTCPQQVKIKCSRKQPLKYKQTRTMQGDRGWHRTQPEKAAFCS